MLSVNKLVSQPNTSFKGIKQDSPANNFSVNKDNQGSNVAFTAGFYQRFVAFLFPSIDLKRKQVEGQAKTEVNQAGRLLTEIMSMPVKPESNVLVAPAVVPAFGKSLNILA